MIEDWINKNNLAKMGFSFNPDDLDDFQVSCFNIISNKMRELEYLKMKQSSGE